MTLASSTNATRCAAKCMRRLQHRASRRFAWHWQPVQVAGRTIPLAVPSNPLQLLSDLCGRRMSDGSEVSDPFWAQVWRSTAGIDAYLGRRNLADERVLELGCGTGAAGIAALLRGADVTFTDGVSAPLLLVRISLAALEFQRCSDECNPASIRADFPRPQTLPTNRWRVRRLRFGRDPLAAQQYSLIIGSDISYLKEVWPELLQTLDTHLVDGGEALLSDPYRSISTEFSAWVRSRQWRADEVHQPLDDTSIRVLKLTRR